MVCDLCNLKKITEWYYEDDYFIVCDCKDCKTPMIVSKRHTMKLNQKELIDLMWIITNHLGGIFMNRVLEGTLIQNQRKIKDHWHIHII